MKRSLSFICSIVVAVTAAGQNKYTVYFDPGKSEPKPECIQTLDSIFSSIASAKSSIIDIVAFCDASGDDESNQILSEQRAKTVGQYFRSKKISVSVSETGFGENSPAAENSTANGKAKNRRAVIAVTIPKTAPPPLAAQSPKTAEAPKEIISEKIPEQPEILTDNSIGDLTVGKILVLKNLNFEGGTAMLLREAYPSLELLLKVMKENPTLEIEIEGHVCCANDMPLSIARAIRVYKYLVENGIDEGRLRYQGHSNFQPITNERDEDERIINRRVEIKIMKK